MQLDVLNIEGASTGRSVNLPDEVFNVEMNEHLLYLAVKQHMANKRQGTHEARERGEVVGSTRKIKRQKGTGTARAGSIKNPLFRGGGRVFGPRPRSYSIKLNKKTKRQARRVALTQKAQAEQIMIVEDFTFEAPKTQQYVEVIKALKADDKRHLLVLSEQDQNVYLSGRNVKKGNIRLAQDLSVYDIMHADKVIFSEGAVDVISNQLKNS